MAVSAQQVTEQDLRALDLSKIDESIERISTQVAVLRGSQTGSGLGTLGTTQPSAPQQTAAVAPQGQRSRSNALCFRDSLSGHQSASALDAYFDTLETMVARVNTTAVAFEGLKPNHAEGMCPSYMLEMLASMDNQVGSVSRRDLSDIAFHLETCWPDDGVTEMDGSELDMESRYQRARSALQLYGRTQRAYREAAAWCE
ncbi:MAG: hypothetical protein AAF566_05325 [Pseudomonadota bacterium]